MVVSNKVETKKQIIYTNSQVVNTRTTSTINTLLFSFNNIQNNNGLSSEYTTNPNQQYIKVKSNEAKICNFNKTLEDRINNITTKLQEVEKENGFIGNAWSWTKNTIGFGDSSDNVRELQSNEVKLLAQFNANENNRAQIFKQLTNCEYTEENLAKFINGQLKLKSEIAIEKYKEGQDMAVDITSDIVSGLVAYGTATACIAGGIAAAPFTAGASLGAISVGVGIAAGAGAVTKVVIKGGEALCGDNEYSLKQAGKDATIGLVSGALAPVTIGAGAGVANSVGKSAPKFIATTARLSVEGATFGAADGTTRSALEGDSIGDIALNGLKGAGIGLVASNILGHSGNAVGKVYNLTFQTINDNGYSYTRLFNTSKKFNVSLLPEKWKKITLHDNSLAATSIKNPYPENLYEELRRCKYSTTALRFLLAKNPNLSRTVGAFPNDCGIKCSEEMTLAIDKILSMYSKQYHVSNKLPNNFCQQIEEELSKIINMNIKVSFLGIGKVGQAFTITINNKKYVYKIYHNTPLQAGISEVNGHGNYPELLSAIRANEDDAGHFAKLYMGRFGENNDGYILTEFVEAVEKNMPTEKIGFKNFLNAMQTLDFSPDNVVNGVIRDFGACGSTSFGYMSKEAQILTKKVFELLDKNSAEELKSLVALNKNNNEYKEMINYLECLKQRSFGTCPQLFAERKDLFHILNIDYKPDIRAIINKYKFGIVNYYAEYQDFLKYYGLTKSQWEKIITNYLKS